jgi:hypothetical protein
MIEDDALQTRTADDPRISQHHHIINSERRPGPDVNRASFSLHLSAELKFVFVLPGTFG